MARDWYRTAAWDMSAQEDFERRLARARPSGRAQYLRIKGIFLAEAGQEAAAQTLWERVIRDHGESLDCRMSIEHLGDMARRHGDGARAEKLYRQLLAQWPDLNATTGMAEVSLAELLLDLGTQSAAHEALHLLKSALDRGGAIHLNTNLFRWHIALVRASELIEDQETVRRGASTALQLAERGPQFSRHPTVGVVNADPVTLSWLRQRAQ